MKKPESFICPLCDAPLTETKGSSMDIEDGVTLWCPNASCPAQEVFGHASNPRDAYSIILDKYKTTK